MRTSADNIPNLCHMVTPGVVRASTDNIPHIRNIRQMAGPSVMRARADNIYIYPISPRGCVDLSMDTMHLKHSVLLF